jgi:hypothetical protein
VVATSLCQSAGRYPLPHGILIGSGVRTIRAKRVMPSI